MPTEPSRTSRGTSMGERLDFDFSPALEKSPCSDCPALNEEVKGSNITQGLATIKASELCPEYKVQNEICLIRAMRSNLLIASQIDPMSD